MVDACDFGFELFSQLYKSRPLGFISGSKRRAQMIECQVNVVERISNLVSDCCCEPAVNRALLRLMQLQLELARASELRSHFIKGARERSHLVEAVCRHLFIRVST